MGGVNEDERTFVAGGLEYRVRPHPQPHLPPRLDCRVAGYDASVWAEETSTWIRHLAGFAAEAESRCNEYHETTDRQAARIAEMESRLALAEERERILEDAWSVTRGRVAGIYDDFQGPEDALLQMSKWIGEAQQEIERYRDDVRDLEGRLASAAEQLRARETEILVLRAEADELRGAIADGRWDLIP